MVDPNCPTLECEHDTWCRNLDGSTMKKTYFYLDDGTKCPACRRCIGKRNLSMCVYRLLSVDLQIKHTGPRVDDSL